MGKINDKDVAKTAAKGAVDATKVAAKAATGNYAGALKDFFKNPGGVILAVITPLIIIGVSVIFALSSFFTAIWDIFTDNVPKSVADQYIEFEQEIIQDSFTPAYNSVSEKILTDICTKVPKEVESIVKEQGLDNNYNLSAKNLIFKDNVMLQEWFGRGYQQAIRFHEMGDSYSGIEKIKRGQNSIFCVAENQGNGFDVIYNNNNAQFSSWDKVTHIIDYNNVKFDGDTPTYIGGENKDNVNTLSHMNNPKIHYKFIYHNKKFYKDAPSIGMFKAIFDAKYDYDRIEYLKKTYEYKDILDKLNDIRNANYKHNNLNEDLDKKIKNITNNFKKEYDKIDIPEDEKTKEIEAKVKSSIEKYYIGHLDEQYTSFELTQLADNLTYILNDYRTLNSGLGWTGTSAFFIPSEVIEDINHYINQLKTNEDIKNILLDNVDNPVLKAKVNNLPDKIDEENLEASEDKDHLTFDSASDFAKSVTGAIEEDRKKMFKDFMSDKKVYENLLEYNLDFDAFKIKNGSLKLDAYNEEGNISVENIAAEIDIGINISLCSYEKLGEIFELYTLNNNGEKEMTDKQKELLEYIMNNVIKNKDAVSQENVSENNNDKKSEQNSQTEESDKKDTIEENPNDGKYLDMSNSLMLWPIRDIADSKNDKYPYIYRNFGEDFTIKGTSEKSNETLIIAPYQDSVSAVVPGTVIDVDCSKEAGNYIIIQSNAKINDKDTKIKIKYKYLNEVFVYKNQIVDREHNVIGTVGLNTNEDKHLLGIEFSIDDGTDKYNLSDISIYLPDLKNNEIKLFFNGGNANNFNYTYESFIRECEDAGETAAAVLTDAGYLQSSMYWQYNQICYNYIFCQAVSDYSKLPFFIDKEDIAKNPDGTLKIEKYYSADYGEASVPQSNWGAFWKGVGTCFKGIGLVAGKLFGLMKDTAIDYPTFAKIASTDLNKTFYAVYCEPGTIVRLPFAAYMCNVDGTNYTYSVLNNFWYGNSTDGRNFNYTIKQLPSSTPNITAVKNVDNHTAEYLEEVSERHQENIELDKDKPVLKTHPFSSSTHNKNLPFSYASYCFKDTGFVFDVANLQISHASPNGDEFVFTGRDYATNNGYNFIHPENMAKSDYKTINEISISKKDTEDESVVQMNSSNDHPVILGNSLLSENYEKDSKEYEPGEPNTYPFFVVSTCIIPENVGENIETKAVPLDTIFDLDIINGVGFNDETTGFTWPLLKSYEHENILTAEQDLGVVEKVDEKELNIIINKNGQIFKIDNVIPSSQIKPGMKIPAGFNQFGRVPDGITPSLEEGYFDSSGKFIFKSQLLPNGYLKISTNILTRTDTAVFEDNNGLYQKILALTHGYIVSLTQGTGNNDGNILIYSEENDLYYEYDNIKIWQNIIERYDNIKNKNEEMDTDIKTYITNGEVLGTIKTFNLNDELNSLNVKIFKAPPPQSTKEMLPEDKSYVNLTTYFPNLGKAQTSLRRIVLRTEKEGTQGNLATFTGRMLFKGDKAQIYAWIYPLGVKLPDSAKELVWASSDDNIVTVTQDGLIEAKNAGVAIISCSFKNKDKNGSIGVAAQATIQVPETIGQFYLKYRKQDSIDNKDINKKTFEYAQLNKEIKLIMQKDKNSFVDFIVEGSANSSAFQGAEWSLTDKNGNPLSADFATLEEKEGKINGAKCKFRRITSKKPHKKGDYMCLHVKSAANAGDVDNETVVKIVNVMPISSINLKSGGIFDDIKKDCSINMIDGFNRLKKNVILREGKDFTISPSNATYSYEDLTVNFKDGLDGVYSISTSQDTNNDILITITPVDTMDSIKNFAKASAEITTVNKNLRAKDFSPAKFNIYAGLTFDDFRLVHNVPDEYFAANSNFIEIEYGDKTFFDKKYLPKNVTHATTLLLFIEQGTNMVNCPELNGMSLKVPNKQGKYLNIDFSDYFDIDAKVSIGDGQNKQTKRIIYNLKTTPITPDMVLNNSAKKDESFKKKINNTTWGFKRDFTSDVNDAKFDSRLQQNCIGKSDFIFKIYNPNNKTISQKINVLTIDSLGHMFNADWTTPSSVLENDLLWPYYGHKDIRLAVSEWVEDYEAYAKYFESNKKAEFQLPINIAIPRYEVVGGNVDDILLGYNVDATSNYLNSKNSDFYIKSIDSDIIADDAKTSIKYGTHYDVLHGLLKITKPKGSKQTFTHNSAQLTFHTYLSLSDELAEEYKSALYPDSEYLIMFETNCTVEVKSSPEELSGIRTGNMS